MTDPVAQSQVLPYVFGLVEKGYRFTILSFEKKARFASGGAKVAEAMTQHGVEWVHLSFSTRPPMVAKLWDMWRMRQAIKKLNREHQFSFIHCRSYPPALAARWLSKRGGPGYLFDMRGFWVDERVDGGMWNLKNPLFAWMYRRYKRKEQQLVADAAGLVSLTEAGRTEVRTWGSYDNAPFEVIPCGADLSLFKPFDEKARSAALDRLGWPADALVLGYLGSLGQWYNTEAMADFTGLVFKANPTAHFLFLTADNTKDLEFRALANGVPVERLRVLFVPREQVPNYLAAFDVSWLFFRPAYSQKARSPIKLGEMMALGIPVICNEGTGDVDQVVRKAKAGLVLPDLSEQSLKSAADELPQLLKLGKAPMRAFADSYYDLQAGVEKYHEIYRQLLAE